MSKNSTKFKPRTISPSVNVCARTLWRRMTRERWDFAMCLDLCAILLANVEMKGGGKILDNADRLLTTALAIQAQLERRE